MVDFAVDMFVQVLEIALPIGVIFEIGNLVVGTVMRTAFGGKLWFGK